MRRRPTMPADPAPLDLEACEALANVYAFDSSERGKLAAVILALVASVRAAEQERDEWKADSERRRHNAPCGDRRHAHFDKLISRFPGDGPLYPDATLGQDVAFVAMMLQDHKDKLAAARAALEECAGAMEPFANASANSPAWAHVPDDEISTGMWTFGHYRRAAAAARRRGER
jgi:hypothetical protein